MQTTIQHPQLKGKTITIIRHAESLANVGLYHGKDARLSENGKMQASALNGDTELIILSPLKRTMETYLHSNIKTQKLLSSELFREMLDGALGNLHENEDHKIETVDMLRSRIKQAIDFLAELKENRVTIISHGMFIWYFLEFIGTPVNLVYNCQAFTINFI
jgi:broad specificity phosphatase PhoE